MDNPPADTTIPDDGISDDVVSQSQTNNHDLPCLHCGYNLRGMTADKQCPECGEEVGRSLRGDQLHFSDLHWVRRLSLGVNLIAWGANTSAATLLLSILLMSDLASRQFIDPQSLLPLMHVLLLLAGSSFTIGVWLMTTPESGVLEASAWTPRNISRWAVMFAAVICFLSVSLYQALSVYSNVLVFIGINVSFVGIIFLMIYAYSLSVRMPNHELAVPTRIVTWGYGVFILIFDLIVILPVLMQNSLSRGKPDWIMIFACPLFIAFIVLLIWSMILTIQYYYAFRKAVETAELIRATQSPQSHEAG